MTDFENIAGREKFARDERICRKLMAGQAR
nr:MAG TPA: hypothetical protein [Caudoviricetes sp.]